MMEALTKLPKIVRMNELNDKENRYKESNDDVRQMRNELNKLSGSVGDLVVAIKGNDLGTKGLVGRINEMEEKLLVFEQRLDETELAAKEAKIEAAKKQFYLVTIFGLAGVVLGTFLKTTIDHLFKK